MKIKETKEKNGRILRQFYCPGCQTLHTFDQTWKFNGNYDVPTFNPSLVQSWQEGVAPNRVGKRCHLFITRGEIHYCGDSTHYLAGESVPMQEIPDRYFPKQEENVGVELCGECGGTKDEPRDFEIEIAGVTEKYPCDNDFHNG